jgi:hypothetical protein
MSSTRCIFAETWCSATLQANIQIRPHAAPLRCRACHYLILGNSLAWLGGHGRWVLPLGLLAGLLLPTLADVLRETVPWCIALLLVVACLRIDVRPTQLLAALPGLTRLVLLLQLATPLVLASLLLFIDCPQALRIPVILVAAAAPIAGSPNLVIMLGAEPTLALRSLIVGTALMPLTSIPVLYMLEPAQSPMLVLQASMLLLAVIVAAITIAWWLRRYWLRESSARLRLQLDGVAALLLAVMVMGLMSAIHRAWDQPRYLGTFLLLALVVNIGLQCAGVLAARLFAHADVITLGVISGNRNIALFLTALPAAQVDSLMLFIACYQVPMYLTPLLGRFFYRPKYLP